jgi:UrcA family protein
MTIRRALLTAAALVFTLSVNAPVLAQDDKAYVEDEGIVVTPAPYVVHRYSTHRRSLGEPTDTLALSTVVSSDGLDLRYASDVRELRRRVRGAAQEVCAELADYMAGQSLTSDTECVRGAVADARPQLDALVYRARY